MTGARLALSDDEPLPPEDRLDLPLAAHQMIERLYRTESASLLQSLYRRNAGADDAQDLVQDAFVRLARRGRDAAALERPQAYLKRIAANLLRDRSRRDTRQSRGLHIVADEEALAGQDQESLLESRDMLSRIEAAMLRLKPRTREIFMAHRIDGLSYAEIAGRTGLSVKGVEKHMSKALQHIDRHLSRYR